jgi:hypothetical protein
MHLAGCAVTLPIVPSIEAKMQQLMNEIQVFHNRQKSKRHKKFEKSEHF